MSTELLKNETKPVEAKDLVKLQAFRLKSGNGIGIYVKSEILENFIRSNVINPESLSSNAKANYNTSATPGWKDHMGYKIAPKEDLKNLSMWGQGLINGTNANLSFLTVKGLSEGVTFEFEGMYSQTTVEKFLMDVKKQIKQIYNDYIKEKNWILTAELREIE